MALGWESNCPRGGSKCFKQIRWLVIKARILEVLRDLGLGTCLADRERVTTYPTKQSASGRVVVADEESLHPADHLTIRVLLIEADGPVRRDVAEALKVAGCQVRVMDSIPTGCGECSGMDVALVDVGASAEGWDRMSALRQMVPELKVLWMSVDRSHREVSRSLGYRWFVEKPFSLVELLEALRRVVGSSGQPWAV